MGQTPSLENWDRQVDYQTRREEILNSTKKTKLSQTDIDLAKMQKRDLKEETKKQAIRDKKLALRKLDDDFGIEREVVVESIELPIKVEKPDGTKKSQNIFDMINGKGNKDGLQDKIPV